MTSARYAVHKALFGRLSSILSLPVRVGPTRELPYVRIDGSTEGPTGENKRGEASTVRPLVSVFSEDFGEANETLLAVLADLRDNPLEVPGFRVLRQRVEQTLSAPEHDVERTIYGERAGLAIEVEPMAV